MTNEQGWEALRAMDRDGMAWNAYRNTASVSLEIDFHGTGQGISSSDTSHRMVRYICETEGNFAKLFSIYSDLKDELDSLPEEIW